ncbi:MAG: hypothetical protein IIB75_05955 [Proteobacteria bacterium]|nr:hypothetical protein [Pseudomonadota bacterium]
MDTTWIQVFILTFAECVAPAGKTVCQEQQFELQFAKQADCEYALEQLLAMKDGLDNVIVNRRKSGCAPSAMQTESFASLEAINEAFKDKVGWTVPGEGGARRAIVNADHRERLVNLYPCEETGGIAPCRIGDIIVEEATTGEVVEIWKRD